MKSVDWFEILKLPAAQQDAEKMIFFPNFDDISMFWCKSDVCKVSSGNIDI